MISSLQMEGVDSSFDMQMLWLETCSQAAINLFETFSHSPPPFRDKVHTDENQDNDRHKEALMSASGLMTGPHQDFPSLAVKFTQTETIMCDFASTVMCFVFLKLQQGSKSIYRTISNDTLVLHADVPQKHDAHKPK